MKKRFSELLDKTDAVTLSDTVDSMIPDKISDDVVLRIQKRVTGNSVQDISIIPRKRWITAFSAAACFIIILAAIISIVIPKKEKLETSPNTAEVSNTPSQHGSTVDPESSSCTVLKPQKCTDTFSKVISLGEGSFSDGNTDRDTYRRLRFYEDSGNTFMIYYEDQNVYSFDGKGLHDTGVKTAEAQFFTEGAYGGYTYVGGVFHCVGGNESGLFRVDLSSGIVEKFIDCNEIVSAVVVDGSKLYYSTYSYKGSFGDGAVYYLKLADLEKKEINVLYETDSDYINGLTKVGDFIFFSKQNAVCWVTEDMMLHTLETCDNEPVYYYAVSENLIYVYSFSDASGIRTYRVKAYNADGSVLASVSDTSKHFIGSTLDTLTVYDGKIVAFDEDGFYLLDIVTARYESIYEINLFENSGYYSSNYWHGVSKAVYDGKLYINYDNTVIEYDNNCALSFTIK